ncbi:MAG TPA: kelch repeat-containing protein [Thermomicrobiaceae bacterium]|nr:kelch repeat-containing protein [Thermomicrobiaceae bacterium]
MRRGQLMRPGSLSAAMLVLSLVAGLSGARAAGQGQWFPVSSASIALSGDTVLLNDGRVLVGGRSSGLGRGGEIVDQVVISMYDPLSGAWSRPGPGDATKGNGAPVLLADGRVLFTGGVACGGISPSSCGSIAGAQVFDPVTGSWSSVAPLPSRRDGHSAIRLADGSVLVVGGEAGSGEATGLCSIDLTDATRYDPRTDSWSPAGSIASQAARCAFSLTLLPDSRVLATGGDRVTAQALLYDPAANAWSATSPMMVARAFSTATLLPNGNVLVAGGKLSRYSGGWTTAVEAYDPEADHWTAVAPLPDLRWGFSATLLSSGRVLIAGGSVSCGSDCVDAAALPLLYDPSVNQWLPAAPMLQPLADPSAVLLRSGAVLLVDGSAELYVEQAPGPLDRQPPPVGSDPAWVYFPATGHYLAGGFRACWRASGGLTIFGYPLSEEFQERDPGTGHTNVVQYTERARFEYPGDGYSSGAPCNPDMGRVGAELAQARGLLDTTPFQRLPLPAGTGSDANCTFFAETGHRLCFGFRQFWQSHGLDLGGQQTAYWKSVALFGYPISEEFTDPDTGLTVQYFERARFEYHPENPAGYKVELGRVGAELLAAQGR